MHYKRKCLSVFQLALVVVLVLCTSILNIHIPPAAAVEKNAADKVENATEKTDAEVAAAPVPAQPATDESARDVAAEYQAAAITEQGQIPEPETTKSGSGGRTLLYAGLGIAAIAAVVAVAAGSSGGSSDPVVEEPVLPPVGADLAGNNWHGQLTLVNSGVVEDVTATVQQNGSELIITTSSTQPYGKSFVGSINRNGFIDVQDQITGEEWSTHFTNARSTVIDLYDFVNNFDDLDRLFLTREATL